MTDRKPLLLVQQFRHVTKARKTYLSEAQERSRTLGDILNRLGVCMLMLLVWRRWLMLFVGLGGRRGDLARVSRPI